MANVYLVRDDDGRELDARFSVEDHDIVFQSRGGARGKDAVNADYSKALLLLLQRLSSARVPVTAAWVDSATVQALPLSGRTILDASEGHKAPEQIAALLGSRMKAVRNDPNSNAKGGNSTKRIRIATGFLGNPEQLASLLHGQLLEGDYRSMDRLPAEVLNRATSEHIWAAVQKLQAGEVDHPFGPSTDFDLIADDGSRLPPKAVFGIALSMALGGVPVEPKHFTAGETSTCFRLLRAACYQVVRKGEPGQTITGDADADAESVWNEGKMKLVSHLRRERGAGLASAKKAQYRREHDKLTCERCGLDPVERYGTVHAEACIEVHHATTHVSDMVDGHKTTLEDLQCLCANCHRLVHRALRAGEPLP